MVAAAGIWSWRAGATCVTPDSSSASQNASQFGHWMWSNSSSKSAWRSPPCRYTIAVFKLCSPKKSDDGASLSQFGVVSTRGRAVVLICELPLNRRNVALIASITTTPRATVRHPRRATSTVWFQVYASAPVPPTDLSACVSELSPGSCQASLQVRQYLDILSSRTLFTEIDSAGKFGATTEPLSAKCV